MAASSTIRLPAPAKLNLFLRITGRREDGYHELQTVFQFLDLCDDIDLTHRADGRIRRLTEIPGVAPEQDLMVRAARALQLITGTSAGVDINIVKRIPMGGGLGGGSSDAASVLLGLNELWGLDLSTRALARIGRELGADVPVFVHGQAAWAEGIGEELTPIEIEERELLLALPDALVETAAVFAYPELTRNSERLTITSFPSLGTVRRVVHLMAGGNVCEAAVRARFPVVNSCLDWLAQWGVARMTGTGAACFAVPEDDARLTEALAADTPWRTLKVRSLSSSPVLERRTWTRRFV
ncbi:MAG: 4-(cytidine 5'-diphospho)-2-C-methyl-D-erythritol kinase [Pseudomonadota bacterium]